MVAARAVLVRLLRGPLVRSARRLARGKRCPDSRENIQRPAVLEYASSFSALDGGRGCVRPRGPFGAAGRVSLPDLEVRTQDAQSNLNFRKRVIFFLYKYVLWYIWDILILEMILCFSENQI